MIFVSVFLLWLPILPLSSSFRMQFSLLEWKMSFLFFSWKSIEILSLLIIFYCSCCANDWRSIHFKYITLWPSEFQPFGTLFQEKWSEYKRNESLRIFFEVPAETFGKKNGEKWKFGTMSIFHSERHSDYVPQVGYSYLIQSRLPYSKASRNIKVMKTKSSDYIPATTVARNYESKIPFSFFGFET